MNYEFLAEARHEFWEAALYYESKEEGLGVRFRAEVSHVINRILADPYLWRERAGGYRRVNCPVFPYYMAYFFARKQYSLRPWHMGTDDQGIGRKEKKTPDSMGF